MKSSIKLLILFVFFISISKIRAQGIVSAVSPASASISTTVTLQISGVNTVFSQATTGLSKFGLPTLLPDSETPINDSLIEATYTIPNNLMYTGWWNVNANNAAPLNNGFEITANGVVLQGSIYRDSDMNCFKDPTEQNLTNFWQLYVSVQPGNITVPIGIDGYFSALLPLGTYTATVSMVPDIYFNQTFGTQLCDSIIQIPISATAPQTITNINLGFSKNKIIGTVYADDNTDCINSPNDTKITIGFVRYFQYGFNNPMQIASVQYDSVLGSKYSIELPGGYYNGYLDFVPYTAYPSLNPAACPGQSGNVPLQINSYTPSVIDSINFAIQADTCPKLLSFFYDYNKHRPCTRQQIFANVFNASSIPATNVEVKITLDSNMFGLYSIPAWSSVIGSTYTISIPQIDPMHNAWISFIDSLGCNAQIGDTSDVHIQTEFQPSACVIPADNNFLIRRVVTNSFDPNNKETVYPYTEMVTANDEFIYAINFQNTGNDTAYLVTLVDDISDKFDPLTITPLMASHPYTWSFVDNNTVKFLFQNINLPDSNQNEPESHGFIMFKIRQKPGNMPGDTLQNRAAIYFDFNEPVITNYTYNYIPLVSSTEDEVAQNVFVYPNPFSGVTRFTFNNKAQNAKCNLEIYSVDGRLVKSVHAISSNYYDLNADDLSDQIYFYRVYDNQNLNVTGKIVLLK